MVDFALAELNWGDCHKNSVTVENFKTQVTVVVIYLLTNRCYLLWHKVVSGTIHSFDLMSSGDRHSCLTADLMSCHMSVYSQPWTDTLQVNWDSSTCDKAERKRSNHKSKNKQPHKKDVEVNILPGKNANGNDCNDADGNKGEGADS